MARLILVGRLAGMAAVPVVVLGAVLVAPAVGLASGTAVPAGSIATVAGGVGGPALGTAVAIGFGCGLASAGGVTYVATQTDGLVRAVSEKSGWLTTQAGVGLVGSGGDGGPATAAELNLNSGGCAVAVDHGGNLLIDQNDRIRVVVKQTGTWYGRYRQAGDIYTIAGGGSGALRNGAPATRVSLGFSSGVAIDRVGNVVIADWPGNRVLLAAVRSGTFYGVRARAGDIYTIAGEGRAGFSGDRGSARRAELNAPVGVAVDRLGNVLIADAGNHRVRVVPARRGRYFGQAMKADVIYTVAGNGRRQPLPLGLGGNARDVGLDGPAQVAVDSAGNLLIADGGDDEFGVVAARNAKSPYGGFQMSAGDIYGVAGDGLGLGALGVAADSHSNIVMEDGSAVVRVFAEHSGYFYGQKMQAGTVYAIAGNGQFDGLGVGTSGDGRAALTAQFGLPTAIAVDRYGNRALADRENGTVRLVAHSSGTFYGQPMAAGQMYTIASDPRLFGLYGIAFDPAGNLVATTGNFSEVFVVAASSGTFYSLPMTAGSTYLIGGGGTQSGDGIPATSAALNYVSAVTVDAAGNVLIADSDDGRVQCIPGSSGTFYGQPMTAGDIYTVAGNGTGMFSGDGAPATDAGLKPSGLALDSHGNIVIADTTNHRVRVVAVTTGTFYGQQMTAGDIYTIAGNGQNANNGDGGPATSAAIAGPWDQSLAVDPAGNLVVSANRQIRVIATATGTFYGIPMHADDIYTIAGSGSTGFSGDGGPALKAEFAEIDSVAIDPAGNILVGDKLRIRSITP